MGTIIIETKDRDDVKFWLNLAKRTGNRAKILSTQDIEDASLAMLIKEGMNTENVGREIVMKALENES